MLKNGIYNFGGTAVKLGLSILTVPILVYYLGNIQFGLYVIITSIMGIASVFESSISTALTVYLSQENLSESNSKYTKNVQGMFFVLVILISFINAIVLLSTIPLVRYYFNNLSENDFLILTRGTVITIGILSARLFQQYFIGIEQGNKDFIAPNAINVSYGIIMSISTIWVAYFHKSILMILWSQALITYFFVVVHYFFCIKLKYIIGSSFIWPTSWKGFFDIIDYVFKAYFGSLGGALFSYGDKIIVSRLLGLEVGGIYSAMVSITTQINILSAIPFQALVPDLSNAFSRHVKSVTEVGLNQPKLIAAYAINICIAFLVGGAIISISPEISIFLLREQRIKVLQEDLTYYLSLLTLVYATYSTNAFGYYVMLSFKNAGQVAIIQLVVGIVTLGFIWILSERLGLLGAVLGNFAYLLVIFFTWFASKRLTLPFFRFLQTLFPYLCLLIGFTFSVGELKPISLRMFFLAILCIILLNSLVMSVRIFKKNASFYI